MQTPSLRGRVHSLKESEQQERQEQREIDELISGSLLQLPSPLTKLDRTLYL